jgi:hypothetical protein
MLVSYFCLMCFAMLGTFIPSGGSWSRTNSIAPRPVFQSWFFLLISPSTTLETFLLSCLRLFFFNSLLCDYLSARRRSTIISQSLRFRLSRYENFSQNAVLYCCYLHPRRCRHGRHSPRGTQPYVMVYLQEMAMIRSLPLPQSSLPDKPTLLLAVSPSRKRP